MKGPLLHVLAFIYLHLGDHRMYHKEVNRGMVNQVSNINFQFWAFWSVGAVGKIYSNVCPVKIRSKHSSNTLLRLLRIFTGQTLVLYTLG